MQKTCIVIPCYNEANRLQSESFLHYAATHPDIYFLFIDDGSNDNTVNLLGILTQKNTRQFYFITRRQNLGKGASVREGILESFHWQSFDFVGYFDADLATPLLEIDWLLDHLKQEPALEMAFGSRQKTGSNLIHRNPIRHFLGKIYAGFLTRTLHLKVHDTQCGAKIFASSLASSLFQQPFIDRWLFDVEVFCRLKKMNAARPGLIFQEVILRQWEEKGHSRIRLSDLISIPAKTARIFYQYL